MSKATFWTLGLALLGAAAVLLELAMFDWMGGTCRLPSIDAGKPITAGPIGCSEFWLNRYQTLLGSIIALFTAIVAFTPAFGQLRELKKQNDQNEFDRIKLQVSEIASSKQYFFQLGTSIEIANRMSQNLVAAHPSWGISQAKVDEFYAAGSQFEANMNNVEGRFAIIPTDIETLEMRRRLIDIAYKCGSIIISIRQRFIAAERNRSSLSAMAEAAEMSRDDLRKLDDLNEDWRVKIDRYYRSIFAEERRLEAALASSRARVLSQ